MSQTMCDRKRDGHNRTPALVAISFISGWAIVLGIMLLRADIHWLAALAALWLSYNFLSWLVPKWRLAILSRRGATVGLGYAIAGGLVTTLAVAPKLEFFVTLLVIVLNTFLLYIPFLLVQLFRIPPGRPHRVDLVLALYMLAIAFWWPTDAQLVTGTELRLGGFIALATTVTLFLGARFWNRSKWELNIDKRNVRTTLLCSGLVLGAVLFDRLVGFGSMPTTWMNTLYRGAVLAPLNAFIIFGVVQFAMREIVKAKGLQLAERVAQVTGAAAFALFWWLAVGTLEASGLTIAVCGAYAAQKTKAIVPVAIISILGYVLSSVL